MCNSISMSVEEVEVVLDEGVLYVVCLKVLDNEIIFFEDIVWGEVVFDSFELDDKVLFKVDGMFIYYMVNVVDDCLMEIIYVVRGEEWLLSIVYYVLFYWSLGWEQEMFVFVYLLFILKFVLESYFDKLMILVMAS